MVKQQALIKILLLVGVMAGLNAIYTYTIYPGELRNKYPEAEQIHQTQQTADVYYFGESSNVTYDPADSTHASISELTGLFFPNLKLININKYATHAGIYKAWLREIDVQNTNLKAIVITMNLRSFDATWIHSKLETSLQESLVLRKQLPPLVNRFLLSLQAFDNKTEKEREQEILETWRTKKLLFPFPFKYQTVSEWDNGMSQGGYLLPDGSWDMKKIELACHYVKGYAFNLDATNPRIRDFDDIAAWSAQHRIPVYFNLMAENVAYADSLVGKELVFLMQQNRAYLINRYHHNTCKVIDNLSTVNGGSFIDQQWTTEHYKEDGRMAIAKNVADTLRKQLRNEYTKAY